jgi:hypothetical protein
VEGDPGYARRLGSAIAGGFGRRLGGRWTVAATVALPAVAGVAGFALSDRDAVTALVAAMLGVFFWLVVVLLWSAIKAPVELDRRHMDDEARLQKDLQLAQAALDRREIVAGGLAEFRDRLMEGNALASRVRVWPKYQGRFGDAKAQEAWLAEERARETEYREAFVTWREACRQTVRRFLEHREALLDKAVPPRPPSGTTRTPGWLLDLRNDVVTLIERVEDIQRAFEARE